MPAIPARSRRLRWLLVLASLLGALNWADWAVAQETHKQVLVLYSTRRDSQFSSLGEIEVPRILDRGLGRAMDYYSEFIDVARFQAPAYQLAFLDFLRLKYTGRQLDLVIAMHDVATEFVGKNRSRLFSDVPVVFLSNDRGLRADDNSTGLIVERNLGSTIALAQKLQPSLQHVFVVSGKAEADRSYERSARSQFQPFERQLTFTYLTGLPTPELEQRLGRLPPRSMVYYLLVTEDGDGEMQHPLEYASRVAAAANAPTYSWVDSVIDRGVLGGSLYRQMDALDRVAGLALRILTGERARDIPVTTADLTLDQVDWRQLERWGIDEARVPPTATLRFRELTPWQRYRWYIMAAAGLFVLQSALIGALLIHRARRERAESDLLQSQNELRASYLRIRDLGGRLLRAQEGERARIARELHDDISQQMALLEIDLTMLSSSIAAEVKPLLHDVTSRARGISRSVHDLSHRLHPAKLRVIGLLATLQGLKRELSHSGIEITLTHNTVPTNLPQDLTMCLFRVAQEALSNAIKHGGAQPIRIHLEHGPHGCVMSIEDDGPGFDVRQAWGRGLGLISMRERLEAFGGTLDIDSGAGIGTRLSIKVPLPAERESVAV